ncbi:hypothetical protein EWB00_004172 [Schistosoma japonicum]|uniref:SJCHGC02748 protein n=1 Tax=Schistosoma japonicum TaxID=6182 RepID=Q5DBM6_SCHJA|nr:SJCHGC02748 protein [Schistosoma japonicum]KAH8866890.1 hypothetical protein KSF78_0003545 [Schistosoma japonicum]KAH8866891.1 hypothetical protein KSF78_0003545 [Schistosoma japonicum]KAH8866892.1 hypothetical protein KSF78_0003545 [Schistosoma japonicum]KAH8866893.1 hypothetical protein KSF78_0003545 [Schistosoma japonicum]
MGISGTCLTDCLIVPTPGKVLFIISLCIVVFGLVLIFLGICVTHLSGGLHAHLSISYSGIPIVFAGLVTLIISVVRIVSTNESLTEMNLTICEFEKQWNQEEFSTQSISYNLQECSYDSFSVVNKSLSNFNSDSVTNHIVKYPIPLVDYHKRLPMPPRLAVLH